MREHGTILTPAALGPAPEGPRHHRQPRVLRLLDLSRACPAVSLPLLEADGLPMGVQLIGARGDDGRLLRTARWLVRHLAKAD